MLPQRGTARRLVQTTEKCIVKVLVAIGAACLREEATSLLSKSKALLERDTLQNLQRPQYYFRDHETRTSRLRHNGHQVRLLGGVRRWLAADAHGGQDSLSDRAVSQPHPRDRWLAHAKCPQTSRPALASKWNEGSGYDYETFQSRRPRQRQGASDRCTCNVGHDDVDLDECNAAVAADDDHVDGDDDGDDDDDDDVGLNLYDNLHQISLGGKLENKLRTNVIAHHYDTMSPFKSLSWLLGPTECSSRGLCRSSFPACSAQTRP
eukprot:764079-Hanusia_phi.AAC.1